MAIEPSDYIFEASWEVCNKIGGIYTVLSTKAKTLQNLYKDRIIFLGPDVWSDDNPAPDFVESKTLLKKWRETALLPEGIKVRVGRWNIPGKPIAILIKFDSLYATKDAFYGHLWERWGVDSLHAYGDYDEACAFGRACAYIIESFAEYLGKKAGKIYAHFNEWTLASGLLTVKELVPEAITLFTTHATCIGRSICGNGKPLYDYLPGYNGDQMAAELNMQSKHSIEKAASHAADCFTTVSDVTARECTQLLERTPVVTPNGFEPGFVPSKARFDAARKAARQKLLSVARALTGIDFGDDTFIVATSGRCEYRNKGIDVFLDSVATLNSPDNAAALVRENKRVLAFVLVPAWSGDARADLVASLHGDHCTRLADPVITHQLHNYNEDPINSRIHSLGFASENHGDTVSLIYVPCYLKGNDGVFNMSYYDLLIGMDATVFPSYYEPWGYTPLESVAFGVPTITTSLSGFGQWVRSQFKNTFEDCGAVAVSRNDSNYGEVVGEIASLLLSLINLDKKHRSEISQAAMHTAACADWSQFITFYEQAFTKALENHNEK